jgi:sugar-phosphatase
MITVFCSAILFDLDGVLVDSTGAVERLWRIWAKERGVEVEKVLAIAHGVRAVEVIRAVAPSLDAEEELRGLEKWHVADHDGIEVMPGSIDLVRSIPAGRWGVVTSGSREIATERLSFAGVPLPKVMITADDVVNGKPHPEPYLKGARELGVEPEDCVVIEDAPAGIAAAHAAQMKVIALASTYPASKLKDADAVVETLARIGVSANGAGKMKIRID